MSVMDCTLFVSIPGGDKRLPSSPKHTQTGPEVNHVQWAPEVPLLAFQADHSIPSNAEVKNEWS